MIDPKNCGTDKVSVFEKRVATGRSAEVKRPVEDLSLEDNFYRLLKVLNFGLPTLLYGVAGLLWAKHTEIVALPCGNKITIYFWYRENRGSPN